MSTTNPKTGHVMTLGEAKSEYDQEMGRYHREGTAVDYDVVARYVAVLAEYFQENTISPDTFFDALDGLVEDVRREDARWKE